MAKKEIRQDLVTRVLYVRNLISSLQHRKLLKRLQIVCEEKKRFSTGRFIK